MANGLPLVKRSLLLLVIPIIGVQLFTSLRVDLSSFDDSRRIEAIPDVHKEERFLFYYTHSGFSNQLFGLQKASQLAYATNRTLVLPPVLPHKGDKVKDFRQWRSRAAGSKCAPVQGYSGFVGQAKKDATKAVQSPNNFPSFTEIIDFSTVTQHTGLEFIDLPQFMLTKSSSSTSSWSTGKRKRLDLDGKCSASGRREYGDMVELFNSNFGKSRIAVIGSAYVIGNNFTSYHEEKSQEFAKLFLAFPPTPKLQKLLMQVHALLPKDYAGLHIRVNDGQKLDCTSEKVKSAYDRIFGELQENNVTAVVIAGSDPTTKQCFNRLAIGKGFEAVSVNDVVRQHQQIQALIQTFKVQRKTVDLLLDQILVALGKHIVLNDDLFRLGSSFHRVIRAWHAERHELLGMMYKGEQPLEEE